MVNFCQFFINNSILDQYLTLLIWRYLYNLHAFLIVRTRYRDGAVWCLQSNVLREWKWNNRRNFEKLLFLAEITLKKSNWIAIGFFSFYFCATFSKMFIEKKGGKKQIPLRIINKLLTYTEPEKWYVWLCFRLFIVFAFSLPPFLSRAYK